MKFEKALKIAAVVVAVVLIGVVLGWLGGRGKSLPQTPGTTTSTETAATETPNTPSASSLKKSAQKRAAAAPGNLVAPAPAPLTNLIANWEEKLDQILGSEGAEADKAKEMLTMFPNLPEDGQAEVAQHLSNLTADENYAPLGQYLTNTALPESVLDVLLADLLNRPNNLKLPMLYEIAKQGEQNPKASDAKDILELYLDEDYGDNWAQWQTKMEQWLKDNPD